MILNTPYTNSFILNMLLFGGYFTTSVSSNLKSLKSTVW